MSKSICAHLYFAIKLTLGMPLMKVLKNRLKLSTSDWQSTGENYRNNSNLPHFGHESSTAVIKNDRTRTSRCRGTYPGACREDKTHGETLWRTIMAPEEDEVSSTQERANRHKPDKAARDLE